MKQRRKTRDKKTEKTIYKEIGPILDLLSPETVEEYFGAQDHETIWQSLNTSEEHRNRVIEWLETLIGTQVEGEIQEISKRTQALKVQEAYRTFKGISMRRFINKEQSPQCQFDMETVSEYFREIWSRPLEDIAETEEGSMFHLDPRITAQEDEDMQEYMLNEKNIAEVIKSRQDLSASGVDGISYRIMKGAGTEGVKFIKTSCDAVYEVNESSVRGKKPELS
jgi:hypothetical protein